MTTRSPKSPLDDLAAEAAAAQTAYEEAERAAEQTRVEAEQQKSERLREYDHQVVDQYDDAELAGQVAQAEDDLDAAVTASTLGRAWVGLKVAQMRRAGQFGQVVDAAQRIGANPAGYTARPATGAAFEELGRAVDRAAGRVIADEARALEAAREQAGQG